MKNLSNIITIIAVLIAGYVIFLQKPTIKIEEKLIKGDTITITKVVTKIDTVNKYVYRTKVDTITKHDTTYLTYWSRFNIGDSTLGASGKVTFDLKEFGFTDIDYRYPKTVETITDTLKLTETLQEPLYRNEWFYTTIGLILALISLVAK